MTAGPAVSGSSQRSRNVSARSRTAGPATRRGRRGAPGSGRTRRRLRPVARLRGGNRHSSPHTRAPRCAAPASASPTVRPSSRSSSSASARQPRDQHYVARPGGRKGVGDGGEVRASVHEGPGGVARGPRPQAGRVVTALGRGEEPVLDAPRPCPLAESEPRQQRRQQLLAVGASTAMTPGADVASGGASLLSRSFSNATPATRPGWRRTTSANSAGSCPASSPTSTQRTPGWFAIRPSSVARLRLRPAPRSHPASSARPHIRAVPDE